MRNVRHMTQLNHPLAQQAQRPATSPLRRFRAGERNQVRFVLTVDDATSQDDEKKQQNQKLAEEMRQVFIDHKQSYGSRRLTTCLQKRGFTIGRFKTRRLMRELNLKVRYPKRFKVTTGSRHHQAISPNSLDRHSR